ncbi:MAG: hypothetical protein QOJ19_1566 [Acidimicrobiia bacterium]|nr:hypothetical protein [Acidimicrobiia bacterium]
MASGARDSVRNTVRARLQSLDEPNGTLAILGVGGTGKTRLLAGAAERLRAAGRPCLRTAGRFLEQDQHLSAFEDLGDDEVTVRRQLIGRLSGGWLVVDDAQWLDESSLAVLAAVAERTAEADVAVLVAFRPVPTGQRAGLAVLEHHALAASNLFVLAPLDAVETGGLVAAVTGGAADVALITQVLELTGGSPLLADRLVRAWVENNQLDGGRLPADAAATVPEQVLTLIRGRLGSLGPTERSGLVRLAAGLSTPPAVLASLQAAGLLQPDGRTPVALIATALGQVLGADVWAAAIGSSDELRAISLDALRSLAGPMATAGLTDGNARAIYRELGDRLHVAAPGEASDWYRTALRGDPGSAAVRTALAESMLGTGHVEQAVREAEAVLQPPTSSQNPSEVSSPDRARALAVVGAALAARGLWSDARLRYEAAAISGDSRSRLHAAICAAADGELAVAQKLLAHVGEVGGADGTGARLADLASLRVLTALLKSLDPASEVGDVLRTARLAASLAEGSPLQPADAAGVAELAALLAVKADAPATARRLLREPDPQQSTPSASRTPAPSRYGPQAPRATLLAGWAALREGDLAAARGALDATARHHQAALESSSSTVTLLALGLRAALLRQSGDLTAGGQLAKQAPPLLVGIPVDLWTIEAVGELAALLHRFGQARPAETLTATAAGLLDRLGHPPLWAVRFHWGRLQVGVAIRQIERLAEPVAALRRLADAHPALDHYSAAAALWHDVLGGRVDADRVAAVLATLNEVGLSWEASELAGQAAIRVDNGALAKSLLSQAREMRAATAPVAGAGVAESSGAVTPAGLSERECEVGRLVLEGRTHRDIGGQLFISPKTVEHHVAHIRQKLGATSRAEFLAALNEDLAEVDRVS